MLYTTQKILSILPLLFVTLDEPEGEGRLEQLFVKLPRTCLAGCQRIVPTQQQPKIQQPKTQHTGV